MLSWIRAEQQSDRHRRLQNVPAIAYAGSAPLFPGPTQVGQYAAGAQ